MKYTKEYFIAKFEAISDELWCEGDLTSPNNLDCHCALGHCGVENLVYSKFTEEAKALCALFTPTNPTYFEVVCMINDGYKAIESEGNTPKERILNKLKSL